MWRLLRRTLNLGILAHVDAGKTTLTERLLYAAGVIEGVLESTFDGYRPVHGGAPARPRTTTDPRQLEEYLVSLTRQGGRS